MPSGRKLWQMMGDAVHGSWKQGKGLVYTEGPPVMGLQHPLCTWPVVYGV
jgi:hypothetical protein